VGRLGIRILLALAANAVALLLAAALLDGVEIDAGSFVVAVLIFSIASLVLRPAIRSIAERRVRPLVGAAALVTTFVVLLLTDLLSDGISIEGVFDWILATVIVWLASLLYDVVDERLHRLALRGIRDDSADAA
jgi:putative membrane protein